MRAAPYTDSKRLVGVYDGEDKDEPLVYAKDCAALETVAVRLAEALRNAQLGGTGWMEDAQQALAGWRELTK